MIIQCGMCQTKFRFDEKRVGDDGIWLRCGQCKHEFFQSHPSRGGLGDPPLSQPVPGEGSAALSADEIAIDKNHQAHGLQTGLMMNHFEDIDVGVDLDRHDEDRSDESEGKGFYRTGTFWLLLVLAFGLFAAGVGIWMVPQARMQAVKMLSPYFPALEQYQSSDGPKSGSGLEAIKIQQVRQRELTNLLLGKIRVIEGMVVNQSRQPLTRISVRAELTDPLNANLEAQTAYSGNMLSDDELATLKKEEIQQRLSMPQGSTVSNDRISADGQIPFMIVIPFEPPGTVKIYLTIAGAERLLQ
jgi:predicted Zn finger-like uncharacterized protein